MVTASCSGSTDASAPGSHQGTSSGAAGSGGRCQPGHRVQVLHRAVQPVPQLVGHVVDLVEQGGGARVGPPDLALLLLRQRHGAQAEQLVDLQGVEERRLALRRQLRVVVEDDRRAQHHARLVVRAGQHREDAVVVARRDEPLRPLRRVEQRHERRPVDLQEQVTGHERATQPLRPVRRRFRGRSGAVLDAHGEQRDGVRRHRLLDGGRHPQGERFAGPHQPAAGDRLDRAAARDRQVERRRLVEGDVEDRLLLDRLVPRHEDRVTGVEPFDSHAVGVLDRPVLDVQEPHGRPHRRRLAVDHHRRPAPRPLGRVPLDRVGRHQHAPLPAHLVLRRARAVRVEHVPLVEHGVGDGARLRQRPRHERASRSSLATTSSQPTSPCLAAVRREVVVRRPAQAQPRLAGEVRVHGLAPDGDRHPDLGLLVPRHRLHRELPERPAEHRAAEQQDQRDLALLERGEVLVGGDLDVVRQRQHQVEVTAAGEGRQHLRQERQLHRLHGAAPAGAVAEQVDHLGRLALAVGPADRLDPDLAPQRDGVHARAAGVGGPHLHHHGRTGGVAVGHHVEAGEVEVDAGQRVLRHADPADDRDTGWARSSSASKNSPIARHTSAPPPSPVQESRTSPTSS